MWIQATRVERTQHNHPTTGQRDRQRWPPTYLLQRRRRPGSEGGVSTCERKSVCVCELQLCNPVTKSLNTAGVRLLPHRTRFSRETPRRQFRFPNVTSPRSFIYRPVPLGGANTHARAHTHTHSPLRLLHYHILYHCIIRAGLYCCSWQWWSVTKYIYLSYCYILGNILRYTSLWRQTSYMFLFQYSYLIF